MGLVPTSGTDIALYSGIPFNKDYKHTRWFNSINDQLNWFASQTHVATFSQANFQRVEGTGVVLRIGMSVDELWNVNYMSFQNADLAKVFYGFVTKIEYIQKNTTHVHFEIDVLQTWLFDLNFKPSYVAREHCPLWNTDGTPVINTVPENLNYGSEYNVAEVQQVKPYNDLYFMVVISKKVLHTDATDAQIDSTSKFAFTVNGLPQPLNYYILPFYLDDSVPASNFSLTTLAGAFLLECYKTTDAVNNIASIYVTDMLPDQSPYDGTTITFNTNYYKQATIGSANCVYVHNIPYSTGVYNLGNKYSGYSSVTESKLLMYPYTLTTLTDFKGNQIELKNEYINNTSLFINVKSSLGISNKVTYSVADYLTSILTDDTIKDHVNMGHALVADSANDLPVMADMLSAYIQGNRNSLNNKYNQVMFNGVLNTIGHGAGMLASASRGNVSGVVSEGLNMAKGTGNTIYEVQAMNAKIKDISNVPPALNKLGSNSYFDFGHGFTGAWVIKKEITPEYRKKLSDFFNMYGYKVNEVKIPNFNTRQYWNYVQTVGCEIRSNINNEDLEEIKSIFDNGITLWHTDDIGNYTLTNAVIA